MGSSRESQGQSLVLSGCLRDHEPSRAALRHAVEVSISLPARLAARAQDRTDPQWRAWLDQLPTLVTASEQNWTLTLGEPFSPGGQCAWVAPESGSPHQRRVVKIGWPHFEARDEPVALAAWSGVGAVTLLDQFTAEVAGIDPVDVLLLEQALPGTPLAAEHSDEHVRDDIVVEVLAQLWQGPISPILRPLSDLVDYRVNEVTIQIEQQGVPAGMDAGFVTDQLAIGQELARQPHDIVMLHTDLHADNVLRSGSRWLAIDPKPFSGDRAFDVLQHIGTSWGRIHHDANAVLDRMSALCDLESSHVRQWMAARCMWEIFDSPHLYDVARQAIS